MPRGSSPPVQIIGIQQGSQRRRQIHHRTCAKRKCTLLQLAESWVDHTYLCNNVFPGEDFLSVVKEAYNDHIRQFVGHYLSNHKMITMKSLRDYSKDIEDAVNPRYLIAITAILSAETSLLPYRFSIVHRKQIVFFGPTRSRNLPWESVTGKPMFFRCFWTRL